MNTYNKAWLNNKLPLKWMLFQFKNFNETKAFMNDAENKLVPNIQKDVSPEKTIKEFYQFNNFFKNILD